MQRQTFENYRHSTKNSFPKKIHEFRENYESYRSILQCVSRVLAHTLIYLRYELLKYNHFGAVLQVKLQNFLQAWPSSLEKKLVKFNNSGAIPKLDLQKFNYGGQGRTLQID